MISIAYVINKEEDKSLLRCIFVRIWTTELPKLNIKIKERSTKIAPHRADLRDFLQNIDTVCNEALFIKK